MQFLKKHYEKIVLCVVLLSMAAAAIWMGAVVAKLSEEVNQPISGGSHKTKPPVPLESDHRSAGPGPSHQSAAGCSFRRA